MAVVDIDQKIIELLPGGTANDANTFAIVFLDVFKKGFKGNARKKLLSCVDNKSTFSDGLLKLRAHIYEMREEYTSVIITYHEVKNAFVVFSFTVGRSKKSLPWDVSHNILEYPIDGRGEAERNEAALRVIGQHNHLHARKTWMRTIFNFLH